MKMHKVLQGASIIVFTVGAQYAGIIAGLSAFKLLKIRLWNILDIPAFIIFGVIFAIPAYKIMSNFKDRRYAVGLQIIFCLLYTSPSPRDS